MTRHIAISLYLNENDLEAFQSLLDMRDSVARAVAPTDDREQARIVDVLADISEEVAQYLARSTVL